MIKPVASLDDILHRGDWCGQLQQAWYEHIPLSEKMGCAFSSTPGKNLLPRCRKPVIKIRIIRCLPAACSPGDADRMGTYLADAP